MIENFSIYNLLIPRFKANLSSGDRQNAIKAQSKARDNFLRAASKPPTIKPLRHLSPR